MFFGITTKIVNIDLPKVLMLPVYSQSYFSHFRNHQYSYGATEKVRFQISLVGDYMFKVNNKNTRTRCEICSKLTIKTPKRHLILVFLL